MKHEKFVAALQKEQNDFLFWLNDQENIDWNYDEENNTIIVTHKWREE